jgi:hypothetical protein
MKNIVKRLFPFMLVGLAIANVFWLKSPFLGIPIGIAYILYFSYFMSFPRRPARLIGRSSGRESSDNDSQNFILGFLFLLSYLIISGSIFYYLTGLHNWNIAIILLLPLLLLTKKTAQPANSQENKNIKITKEKNKNNLYLIITYYLLLITCVSILFSHQSSSAIVSPWQTIPSYFFIVYFLLSLALFYKIIKQKENKNSIFIFLYILLSASIALIVYKIGYGFDPFIHRSAEKIIFDQGAILPKTPYYIGQYSLVMIFSKLFAINFSFFDKILAPLLGAILIPTLSYFALTKNNFSKSAAQFSSIFAGLLTLFSFFFTTPQHLANIFLISLIFLSFSFINKSGAKLTEFLSKNCKGDKDVGSFSHEDCLSAIGASSAEEKMSAPDRHNWFLWFLALATFFIHPIAGIPAIIFCLFLSIKNKNKIISIILFILSLVAVPFAFFLVSIVLRNFQLSFDWQNLRELLISAKKSMFYIPFNSFLTSLYFLKIIFYPLIIIIFLIGFLKLNKRYLIFPISAIILLINTLFLKLFNFQSVISYEQNIFPMRLAHEAYFFALPFILIAISYIFEISAKTKKGVLFLLIGSSFLAVSILYLTYPRYDIIDKNKGFAVSNNDISAVHLINNIGADENFIVLANQSTSASALQEFGFKKYFKTSIFYYPLPTSSPLYKIYLDITYNGIKPEFISEAKKITGSDTVFIVFTDYWTNFKKLIPLAKETAKNSFEINNGKIWIFEY